MKTRNSSKGITLKIDRNVPIPPRTRAGNESITSVVRRMQVGDSLLVDRNWAHSIRACAHAAGIKMVVRRMSEDKARIWRAA